MLDKVKHMMHEVVGCHILYFLTEQPGHIALSCTRSHTDVPTSTVWHTEYKAPKSGTVGTVISTKIWIIGYRAVLNTASDQPELIGEAAEPSCDWHWMD